MRALKSDISCLRRNHLLVLGISPSGNFPNVQFTKRQLPKGQVRPCKAPQTEKGGPSTEDRPDLESCLLGNYTVGKLPPGEKTLGCCHLEKSLLENTFPSIFGNSDCFFFKVKQWYRCTNNHQQPRFGKKVFFKKKYIFR